MSNLAFPSTMARRLALVALDWTRQKDPPISLGQASIVANLIANKLPVVSKSWSVNHTDFFPQKVVKFAMSNDE